ncbi:MAG: hypothetical protein HY830_22860 [Actinobacteria bacterium]|nr:hypothetical protein [Actinomycetota bacterium]
MACQPLVPATCVVDGAGSAIGGALSSTLGNTFADSMRDGATWVIKTTIAWWIEVPAIDLGRTPVDAIRGYVLWLAIVVSVVGVMWQAILLMLSRRPEPLLNVGRGLFYVALWSSIGVVGPSAALRAGDAFSVWVLDSAAGGQATDRLVALASLSAIQSPGAVTILGLLMMLAGLVQAILMLFREGAVVILSGVVVLAAAGSFTNATRPWLPRVLGWMLALITYKPAAALVYAAALALTGHDDDPRTVVVGLTMMLLAIIALPVLMKFFTWTAGAATSGGGGLAALAAGSAAAIHARAAFESTPSRGGAAATQAAAVRGDLGPASGPAPTGATSAFRGTSNAAPPESPAGGAAPSPAAWTSPASNPSAAAASTAAASGTATTAAGSTSAAAAGPVGAAYLAGQAAAGTASAAGRAAGAALTDDEGSR